MAEDQVPDLRLKPAWARDPWRLLLHERPAALWARCGGASRDAPPPPLPPCASPLPGPPSATVAVLNNGKPTKASTQTSADLNLGLSPPTSPDVGEVAWTAPGPAPAAATLSARAILYGIRFPLRTSMILYRATEKGNKWTILVSFWVNPPGGGGGGGLSEGKCGVGP